MKILVYNVAAEDGGGLFVLKNFYNDIRTKSPEEIEWVVMTSQKIFESTDKLQVLCYEKVKKSWFHRLWFENVELPGIIKEINPDILISLQNMPVKRCKCRQLVYLHQSLQYCPKKFSLLKSAERALALRQKLICSLIKRGLPKSEHIFVQTKWIKDATCKWINWPEEKITIVPVSFDISSVPLKPYAGQESKVFFYPARAEMYKNHDVIIEACKILKEEGINDYKVQLTFTPQDGPYAEEIHQKAAGLPIEFVGTLSYEQMWEYYSKTILLFPSYLETCGVPMMEAKAAGARILASDMPFSHEALDGYTNAQFFQYDNSHMLAEKMKELLAGKEYQKIDIQVENNNVSLMERMLERI